MTSALLLTTPVLRFFLGELHARRLDTRPLLAAHGIDPAAPALRLTGAAEFCDGCAELANDPLFGLHVAERLPRGSYGLIEFVWRSAPTLGEGYAAMKQLASFVSEVFRPAFAPVDARRGRLVYAALPAPLTLGRQAHEFIVCKTALLLRELGGDTFALRAAGFAHPDAGQAEALAAALRVPVSFGQADNWLELDLSELQRPIAGADPALFQSLCAHLAEQQARLSKPATFLEQVERAISERLAGTGAPVADVAIALHLSERTLQRRLETEGTTFRDLVDHVRHRDALDLCRDGSLPLQEIAWRLGFSQYSAFARAYRRWTGRSPRGAASALGVGAAGQPA